MFSGEPEPEPTTATIPAHPVSIAGTMAIGAPCTYGSNFQQTFVSSTGHAADIDGIKVGERISVRRNDFGFQYDGVRLGELHDTLRNGGQWVDGIINLASMIHAQMRNVAQLPAVFDTPQALFWEDASGAWQHIADVEITFTVQESADGGLEAVTTNNGKEVKERFTGPDAGSGEEESSLLSSLPPELFELLWSFLKSPDRQALAGVSRRNHENAQAMAHRSDDAPAKNDSADESKG